MENIIYRKKIIAYNRDICCCEMMQPTIEANSYNSERIYESPFLLKQNNYQ